MCISAFRPSLSPSNFFCHIVYPFGFFVMFFGCLILVQNHLVSFASGCWHIFVWSPRLMGRIFLCCFGMSCFVCIVLLFVDISLIFLLSPVLSGLFPQVSLFFSCVAFSFSSLNVSASFLCLIILVYFHRFFICISSQISHPGFDFFFMLFEGIPISAQINFALA